MAVNWHSGVNTRAYGMDITVNDNLQVQEFESGAKRTWLKNSSPKKKFSFIISMRDTPRDAEFRNFLSWYENTLLSGSQTFYFPNLITHEGTAEYRMTEPFTASGQQVKEVKISVEEV